MLLLGAVLVAPAEVPAHGSLLQGSRPAHLWLTVTEILGVKSPGRETWLTHRCGQSLLSQPQRRMGWSCRCTGHSEPHSALPGWREGRGSPEPQTRTCYLVRETQRKVFSWQIPDRAAPCPRGVCCPVCRDTVPVPGRQPGSELRLSQTCSGGCSIVLGCIERKCWFSPFLELTCINEVYRCGENTRTQSRGMACPG